MLNKMITIFQKSVLMCQNFVCFKTPDVHNFNLLKFIASAMNGKPRLFEECYVPHLSLRHFHIQNSRLNLPPVTLDVERNFNIFQSIKCCHVIGILTMLLNEL